MIELVVHSKTSFYSSTDLPSFETINLIEYY